MQLRLTRFRLPGWASIMSFLPGARTGEVHQGYAACAYGRLAYQLYVPRRLARKPALIVMLHGCTQTAEDFAEGTAMNRLAARHGFLVAYPQQNLAANLNRCWNWFNKRNQGRGGEAAMIAQVIDDLSATYGVAHGRVFVAGLSAGGSLAAILGRAYPDKIAAIGVHSGVPAGAAQNIPGAFSAMNIGDRGAVGPGPTPAIIFQGDVDTTVVSANGYRIAFDPSQGPSRITPRTLLRGWRWSLRFIFPAAAPHARAEYWLVRGLGHAWSGGRQTGSYADPRGPNASKEMMRFFLGYHPVIYPLVAFWLILTRTLR